MSRIPQRIYIHCAMSTTTPTHVVIVTVGTLGDVYPFLGIGLTLQRRGHRVTMLGPAIHCDA